MIWLGIVVIDVFYIICTVYSIAQCVPRSGETGWLSASVSARCARPQAILAFAQGIFGTISDFYVLYIPVHIVSGLRMPNRRKIGVISIFLTGLL
jgi:hypothetical protein